MECDHLLVSEVSEVGFLSVEVENKPKSKLNVFLFIFDIFYSRRLGVFSVVIFYLLG